MFGKLNNRGYGLLTILRILRTFHAMRRWGEGEVKLSWKLSNAHLITPKHGVNMKER